MLVQQSSVPHSQTGAFLCIRRQRKSETHFRREQACAFSTRSRLKHTQTDQDSVLIPQSPGPSTESQRHQELRSGSTQQENPHAGNETGERQRIWREVIASVWISQFRCNWNSLDRFKQGTSQWASCFALTELDCTTTRLCSRVHEAPTFASGTRPSRFHCAVWPLAT